MMRSDISRRTVVGGLTAVALAPMVPARTIKRGSSFLAMGDWGREGTNHQREVAVQMGRAAAETNSRFILAVGDNFYPNGVSSVTDPQWRTSFEDVYTAQSLQVPWYVALGNHDYHGTPEAQIAYAETSKRWRMPQRYYRLGPEETGLPATEIFVMDTTPFVQKYGVPGKAIAKNIASVDVPAQLAWLDRSLGQSTARRKLVVGHHTILSGGSEHGPTPELVAQVKPLLERHGVKAYINGHDHDMQHIRSAGVDYVCCGAGSEVRPVSAVEGTLFCLSRSGFAAITLEDDALMLEFRDYAGTRVYRSPIAIS